MNKVIFTHRNQNNFLSSSGSILIPESNTPAQNVAQLQALFDSAGQINTLNSNPILINDTLIARSNTYLRGLKLKLAPGTNKNMIRNESWGGAAKTISAISTSSVNIGGVLAVVATANVTAHGKAVGDYVFISAVSPDHYNGTWKIRTVPDANSFTFVLAYDVGDAIAAGTGIQLPYIQTVNTTTTNSLTTVSGNAAVTGTGFIAGAEWVGKSLTTIIGGVFTVLGTIQSVASATSMTLAAGASATVTGGKWSIYNPAVMQMYDADNNIVIEDCDFDYDSPNQTTPDTNQRHCVNLRRIHGLKVLRSTANAAKYAYEISNCYDVTANDITFDTLSDGIHFSGSGGEITVTNIKGKTGDDCVAFGNSDYFQYLDANHAFGDYRNVSVDGVNPRMSLTAFKYFGCPNTSMRNLSIRNSGGVISGGNGNLLVITDTNCVGCEAGGAGGGTKVSRLLVDANIDHNSSKPAFYISGATIDDLATPNLIVGMGNTAGTSCGVLIANGSLVNGWVGANLDFYSSSGGFANNAAGIRVDGTSRVVRYNFANAYAKNISWFLLHNLTGNAEDSVSFTVASLVTDTVDYAVLSAGRINVRIGVAVRRGGVASNIWFLFNDFSKISVAVAEGLDGAPSIGIATGKNVQINAPDVGFDLTNTGGAAPGGTVVQQRKSSFFHMSATANGTLERFNTVYWDVTRLKWVQATNTTLLSA